MSGVLIDGKGGGYRAHVNSNSQLVTRAIGVEQRLKSSLDGRYFEASTGQITLTDANETGIIYLLNSKPDDYVMVIDRVFYDAWESTGGSGGGILRYYKDVTITGGTDITPYNTQYNNPTAAVGTFKKSLTTLTGTTWWTAYLGAASSVALEEGRIVLNNGSTHGITIAAPASNTSMKVSVNVAFYYFLKELV